MQREDLQRILRPLWASVGWFGVAVVIALSLTPRPLPGLDIADSDKLAHLLAYAALMWWFAQIERARQERIVLALALAALGVALEFAQGLTPTRELSAVDMAANAAGVGLGWALAPPRGPNVFARVAARLA
jgi:VanZ family protein